MARRARRRRRRQCLGASAPGNGCGTHGPQERRRCVPRSGGDTRGSPFPAGDERGRHA